MRLRFLLCTAILCGASCAVAYGTTITQTFNTGAINAVTGDFTFMANNFNPSLGTLNSITGTIAGTFSSNSGSEDFTLNLNGIYDPANNTLSGGLISSSSRSPVALSGTTTDRTALQAATGSSGLSALLFTFDNSSNAVSPAGFQIGLVYDYTPFPPSPVVSATPEPSTFVLLGTSMLGVAGALRRRFVG